MGISRSAAVTYAALCGRTGPGHERACLEAIEWARRWVMPSPVIVAMADRIMGRGGAMTSALEAWMREKPRALPRVWP